MRFCEDSPPEPVEPPRERARPPWSESFEIIPLLPTDHPPPGGRRHPTHPPRERERDVRRSEQSLPDAFRLTLDRQRCIEIERRRVREPQHHDAALVWRRDQSAVAPSGQRP